MDFTEELVAATGWLRYSRGPTDRRFQLSWPGNWRQRRGGGAPARARGALALGLGVGFRFEPQETRLRLQWQACAPGLVSRRG